MTKIKFCGLMKTQDVIAVRSLGADYAGFILTHGFKRSIGLGTFYELQGYLTGHDTKKVGVFVDEPIEELIKYYEPMLDVIQLHGKEDNEYIRQLKLHTSKPIIKAFTIKSQSDLEMAEKSLADMVLLDSGTGTGKTFDHSLIKNFDRPFILAGGLDPKNVCDAISMLDPFAVDTSSGIETNGRKDKKKMAEFIAAVRKEI